NSLGQGYVGGNASFLLSRAGLRAIAEKMTIGNKACHRDSAKEDVGLGHCAEQAGEEILDTLDENGLERFHPLSAVGMWLLDPAKPTWIHAHNYHPLKFVGVSLHYYRFIPFIEVEMLQSLVHFLPVCRAR
ncbi:Core 1 synthase, glycoprotein-N-acetylgalactosamine 3-beta-galactosyltransferase, 1, partial [Cichlidogyrus casuarinus]